MVHIDKVEIYGFKSFGFKNTTVKLTPGLVSISGPNGSGKSTILDAIAFALGEKSPTILRVDTLKSVINDVEGSRAGTRVARVSIHLDNRDRSIPVDDDRVEITRVMGGTGESAYYLNKKKGTRGRIRDVLEVANAGLGRLNHVQQGTVTRISEFSAEEKRGAIEDLIGLSYFDEKKDLASRQLEQADGRLEVALAKMGDVRTRIIEMEEERNHMVRQDILERDLERYETIRRLRELAVLRRRMGDLESRMEISDTEMKKNATELEAVRSEMDSVEAEKRGILAEASTHDAERTRIEGEIDRMYTKSQNAKSELKAAEGQASRAEARLAEIRSDLADIAVSRARNRRSASGLRARLEEARVQAGRATEALGSINERRREVLGRQSEAAARRARSEGTLRLFRSTLAGHERRLMEVQTRMENAARQASSDRRRLGNLEAGLAESDVNERRLASWIDRHTGRADSVDGSITRLKDERARLLSEAAEMDDLIRRAGQAAARYDSKLRLVRKVMHEDYSIGRLRNDAPGLGVLGLAYELLSWPESVDRAVMAAASDWLKALVVEDMESMAAISEAAVSMGLPRLRIIPLSSIPTTRPASGRLSEHISCGSEFEPLRELIFGGTVLAESEESARRHAAAGTRAVTRSGLCVEPGRAATLDLGSRISNLTKIISMSAEIGGLQNSVSLLERMRAHHSTRLRDNDADLHLESETSAGLRAELAAAAQTLTDAESRSAATRRTLKSLRTRLAAYDSAMPQMKRSRHILGSLVERVKSLISAEEARMPTDSDQIASRLESLNIQKAEFEQLQTQTNTELARMRAEWSGAVSAGDRLLRRASNLASEQLNAIAERRDALSSVPLLHDTIGSAQDDLAALRQTQQQMMETSSQSASRQRSCDSALAGLRKQERALAGEASQMQRRHDSLERDLADCRASTSNIAESLPPRPDPGLPLDTDPAPFIAALKHEMESLPPLNANAPAAYARVTSEYRSMSERKNSLEEERNRIVAFIEDVERDKRQTYLDAFDTVDKEIRSIFDRMSGGSAWLELEDEDDVFGSGIRYMVQFPGKSKRTSASISGGEKTLAAVVFVLALQKLKPSPFYLFDEVDAHLDAPNSERLAGILEERARDNQFIMVSLKESVVQKAGLIYGVYPKNGLTQVVSYRDRRLRPAAR
ncbi:MAG: chromosome segregation protein SMC [Thaumarchaeota archaeon]|nr:chromosome segregation protein SMC [Nitrososphaerota archaeon]